MGVRAKFGLPRFPLLDFMEKAVVLERPYVIPEEGTYASCWVRCDIRTLPAEFVSKVQYRTLAADAITFNRTTENTETTSLIWTSHLYCFIDRAHYLLLFLSYFFIFFCAECYYILFLPLSFPQAPYPSITSLKTITSFFTKNIKTQM